MVKNLLGIQAGFFVDFFLNKKKVMPTNATIDRANNGESANIPAPKIRANGTRIIKASM